MLLSCRWNVDLIRETSSISAGVEVEGKYISLSDELAECGAKLVINTIDLVAEGQARTQTKTTQLHHCLTRFAKMDILILVSTSEIDNKVRAFRVWPGTYTNVGDKSP